MMSVPSPCAWRQCAALVEGAICRQTLAFSWPVCSTADTSVLSAPQVAGEFMQSRHGGQRCLGDGGT